MDTFKESVSINCLNYQFRCSRALLDGPSKRPSDPSSTNSTEAMSISPDNSLNASSASSSRAIPVPARLTISSKERQTSSITDGPTPSLSSDNEFEREDVSPDDQPPPTPPLGPSRAFFRFRGNGIPVEDEDEVSEKDKSLCDMDTTRRTLPIRKETSTSTFIKVKSRGPRQNIFDKRLPSSPFPTSSPRRPPPPRNSRPNASRPSQAENKSDDEDPLSLLFSPPRPQFRPHSNDALLQSADMDGEQPPSSPTSSSRRRNKSKHKLGSRTAPKRRLTLDEEIREAVSLSANDDGDQEGEVYVGVGIRSKNRGFLAHGGAGGVPVFMGAGYVDGVEDGDEGQATEDYEYDYQPHYAT